MNIEGYLKITAGKIGSYVAKNGADIKTEDFARLWNESLDEFFKEESLTEDAREKFNKIDLSGRVLYFKKSIFSLERFTQLARETLQALQH